MANWWSSLISTGHCLLSQIDNRFLQPPSRHPIWVRFRVNRDHNYGWSGDFLGLLKGERQNKSTAVSWYYSSDNNYNVLVSHSRNPVVIDWCGADEEEDSGTGWKHQPRRATIWVAKEKVNMDRVLRLNILKNSAVFVTEDADGEWVIEGVIPARDDNLWCNYTRTNWDGLKWLAGSEINSTACGRHFLYFSSFMIGI